jgi:hypothetical protein
MYYEGNKDLESTLFEWFWQERLAAELVDDAMIKAKANHFTIHSKLENFLCSKQEKAQCMASQLRLEPSHNMVYILNSQFNVNFFICCRHIANSEKDFCL